MTFEIAKREAEPFLISLAGKSGSGKTYSALLLAAGIAGKDGKVGFIDTEAGRGSMYADDVDIISALPDGKYYIKKLTEPFSPEKYMEAIKEAIANKVSVLIIDSMTHEWEGTGGVSEMAEIHNAHLKGQLKWARPKMKHKRLMNLLTQCTIDIIFCLRAREKMKQVKNPDSGKTEMIPIGLQEIQERDFIFEMTLSMILDDENTPGKTRITKCSKPLRHLFSGDGPIITKEIGEKLLDWRNRGEPIDVQLRNLKRECREQSMLGEKSLDKFFLNLKPKDKDILKKLSDDTFKTEVRDIAKEFDAQQLAVQRDSEEEREEGKLFVSKPVETNNIE